jgi:hypothetical protein
MVNTILEGLLSLVGLIFILGIIIFFNLLAYSCLAMTDIIMDSFIVLLALSIDIITLLVINKGMQRWIKN